MWLVRTGFTVPGRVSYFLLNQGEDKCLRGERQVNTKRFLMAGLTLILAMSAYAQQGSTGSIAGTVADPSGQVVPKATVKITSELNGESHTAETNDIG